MVKTPVYISKEERNAFWAVKLLAENFKKENILCGRVFPKQFLRTNLEYHRRQLSDKCRMQFKKLAK